MKIAIPIGNGGHHKLTNEGIRVGDQVFPCISGYQIDDRFYIMQIDTTRHLHNPETMLACTGWPSEPHTVVEFYNDDRGLRHIRTDKGHSPAEVYFKVIKEEGETK